MDSEIVVWNVDIRHRPELEVEIAIVCPPDAIPGEYYARRRDDLEVDVYVACAVEDDADAWFVDDDALLLDDVA
jgi:hypothetical protein